MAQLYKNDVPILTAGSKAITVANNSEYETIYDGGNGSTYDAGAVYYIAGSGQIKKGNVDYGSRTVELTKVQYNTLVSEGEVIINGITYTYDENELYLVTDEEFDGSYQMTKAQYDTLVANGSVVINGKTIVYDNDTAYFITDYPPTQPCYKYFDFTSIAIARDTDYSTIIIHNETNHGILAPLTTSSGSSARIFPLYIPAHKHIKVVAQLSDCICPDGTLLYSRDGGEIYIYNYRDYRNDAFDIGINYMTVTDKWTGTTKIKVNIQSLCPGTLNIRGGSQVYIMPSIWSTSIGPSGYITAYTPAANLLNLKMYVMNNDVIQPTRINITSASISGSESSGAQLNLSSLEVNAGLYIDASDCNETTSIGSVIFELSPQTQSGGGPETQYKILAYRQEQVTPD